MRDFFDVWTLSSTGAFPADEVASAIARTFHRCGTLLTDDPLCFGAAFAARPAKTAQWQAFVRRRRFGDTVPAFWEGVATVAGFLRPVSLALLAGKEDASTWRPGGPWVPHP